MFEKPQGFVKILQGDNISSIIKGKSMGENVSCVTLKGSDVRVLL